MLAAIGTEFLLEKFKFSQGSYKDEKAAAKQYIAENKDNIVATAQLIQEAPSNPEVVKAISTGEKFINSYANNYQDLDIDTLSKATGVTKEDIDTVQKNVNTITKELNNVSSAMPSNESKSPEDHEYVEKIKLPNGEYRYIYEEDLKKKAKKT